MKRLTLLTATMFGVAGMAHAQMPGAPTNQQQYRTGHDCGHRAAITDEYGFRYDSTGNRLNAQGCVIAPPQTPPGGRAIKG